MRPSRSGCLAGCLRAATPVAVATLLLVCVPLTTNAQTIPNAPTNLVASAVSDFQINLLWTETSTNATGFQIARSTDGINFTRIAQVSSNTISFRNNGLFPGTTYYYSVSAYNSAGSSAFSGVVSATTLAPICPLSVVGWGDDSAGEVSMPSTLTNVVEVSAGGAHALALNSDGSVAGWGDNTYGQATPPPGLTGVVAVAAGGLHSIALQGNGTVLAWGYDADGETNVPPGLSNVVAIAGGLYHTLALQANGTVVAWGYNGRGETNVPAGLSNVVAVAAGTYHSLALKGDGTVVAWGYNCCGQTSVPSNLTSVVAIAAGGYHGLALQANGTVVAWGYNGLGETTLPSGLNDVVAIAGGIFNSLALRSDGTVIAWGDNSAGESTVPPGLAGVAAISGGGNDFSLALASIPGPPLSLTATAAGLIEIDLSWNEYSSNLQGFEIDRAADAGGSPGTWAILATNASNVTTYSDASVTANTTYWYRVLAYNNCGASPYSALKFPTTVLLDDTWASGGRTNQNLPTSSAWWTSATGSLASAVNSMTLTVGGSSIQAQTYFTSDSNSPPVQLNVGDTLTATFRFMFNGIFPNGSSSQGFRLALFDSADASNVPARVSADGSSATGLNVQGYALFGKFYGKFSDATPIDIRKRINLTDSSLLGTSGDWQSLAKDTLNTNAFSGFAALTPYSLQLVLQRIGLKSMAITITWSNMTTSAILSDSTIDYAASDFNFDAVAFRPQNNTQAPATNEFLEATITVSSAPIAPSIATEPQAQSVFEGQNATFTVVPNGSMPLSYQWYYNTNTPVANGTGSTLTVTNVEFADAGGYSVLVSNPYGAVTSDAGRLTVAPAAPSITTQPQPQSLTVIPGQYATFTVVATGSQPLYYLWYQYTNILVTTSTSSSLMLTNVQPGNAGTYSVIVSNAAGSVISTNNAALNVNTNPSAPVFIAQPASIQAYANNSVSFGAAAVGTQPITYQWNKNGSPISGATATSLDLTNVQPADAATYTIVASNSVGSTTSSNAVLTVTLRVSPQLPFIPATNFIVTSFGALGDGVTNNAAAIQKTITAAAGAGGGTVEIPSAGSLSTYLSGPITLANNVNLQIDSGAMLQMLPRSNWPGTTTFISGSSIHDVEISGPGTIDGQGTNWWFPLASSRPNFIGFSGSTRILVQNVTLQNPPTFHLMLKGNNAGITIQGITINTPWDSPNTDGMDIASTNVLIRSSFISDGDDNIEIGGSSLAADITVSNCTFGAGHGVSIGSITSGGVHDMLVSNCTFNSTTNGIRMKSDTDRGGLVQNIQYLDITMTNVLYPITIYSYYNTIGTPNNISPQLASVEPTVPLGATTPIWQNILISNLTVTATSGINISGIIWGRPEMLVSNITFYNLNMPAPGKTFDVYNAQGIQFVNSQLTTGGSTNTLTLLNAQITITNSTPNSNLVTMAGLAIPPTNNVLALFNSLAADLDSSIFGPNPLLTLGSSTLAVNNDLNLGGASTLNFVLGTNAAEIAVTGNLTLGGTLNVSDGGGFSNTTYTLFTYAGALIDNGLIIGATPNTNFTYTVSTNILGQVNLVVADATLPQDPFVTWQLQYFNCTNCAAAQPNADPLGKGISNTNQFLLGLNPTNSASQFHIVSVVPQGANIVITWTTAGGHTNMVQAAGGDLHGGYNTNDFVDIPDSQTVLPGSGDASTNYVDSGGATNVPARYYRVRLVP